MSNQAKQFDTKPMYASVASFAKSERAKAEAVLRADQAGMKAYWIESSEKALLENKLIDPDNPLAFDDLATAVYASRGERVLRIMLTDTGALSDKEKADKRKYRGELPQYLKRFKAALDKIQNPKDAAARKVKTLREFIEARSARSRNGSPTRKRPTSSRSRRQPTHWLHFEPPYNQPTAPLRRGFFCPNFFEASS